MNIKPSRINPRNVSPSNNNREPLKNISTFQHDHRDDNCLEKITRRNFKPSTQTYELNHTPSMGTLIQDSKATSNISVLSRTERYSLKPLDKHRIIVDQIGGSSKCANHYDKPSIFKIVSEGTQLFYCEKCAILLASQGFKVERITDKTQTEVNAISRARLFEEGMIKENMKTSLNNAFRQDCNSFLKEFSVAQKECEQIIQHNRDQRERVHTYYCSILNQLNELEHQLKTSITIMVAQQCEQARRVFEEMDMQFVKRLTELDMASIAFEQIASKVNGLLKSPIREPKMIDMIKCQKSSFDEVQSKVRMFADQKDKCLDELAPQIGPLMHFADIIRNCRLGLKSFQKNQQHINIDMTSKHSTHPQQQKQGNTVLFSFENEIHPRLPQQETAYCKPEPQTTAGLSTSLKELDSNVKIIHTNSYNDSQESPNQLKQSIIDQDFSRMLANVRT